MPDPPTPSILLNLHCNLKHSLTSPYLLHVLRYLLTPTAPSLTCAALLMHSWAPCPTHIIPLMHPYTLFSTFTTPLIQSLPPLHTLLDLCMPFIQPHVPLAPSLTCHSLPNFWPGACNFLLASPLTLIMGTHRKWSHLKTVALVNNGN